MKSYNIIAFDKNWKKKGIVAPEGDATITWSDFNATVSFIEKYKPKDEHWLIEVDF